jgi:hypothetical protein
MTTEHLREVIEELHAELERAESVDEPVRDRLREITMEIGELLDRSPPAEAATEEHRSLAERLKESARHFEEDHPSLSSTLGRLIEALGRTIT